MVGVVGSSPIVPTSFLMKSPAFAGLFVFFFWRQTAVMGAAGSKFPVFGEKYAVYLRQIYANEVTETPQARGCLPHRNHV